jgi:cation/acetate symporter
MTAPTPPTPTGPAAAGLRGARRRRLNRAYAWYTVGFVAFVAALGLLEQWGLPKPWIGFTFLLATVALYAVIGIRSRTTNPVDYYVAGREVPALYNGMATGADWMSAASFIGMAGTLYLTGYDGLAFILGWTGGYCLLALLLAPYLRKFGQYTIPDFIAARYGGLGIRLIAIVAAIACSFIYVVAQIYGVGLITTRLTGVAFELGIFLGLGGVLVCSFLGGMRAVTWTQVAQYIVLIIAYLVPVMWLSVKQTGMPLPHAVYGEQLQQITAREHVLREDPKEQQVQAIYRAKAAEYSAKLLDVPRALATDRAAARAYLNELKTIGAPPDELRVAERALASLPKNEAAARAAWTAARNYYETRARPLGGMPPHAQPYAGDPDGTPAERQRFDESRLNFLALVLCLMVGTAALPHILVRCYTTPTVKEARDSVAWSLLFIVLLYITAPALAVMVKFEVFNGLVGTPFDQLPAWIANWSRVDPSLLSVEDVNRDGLLQLGEIKIGSDIIVLAMPEMAGLPYVISGMVAAGGLAAALSTADGLLLTIASSLSHDLYYRVIDPKAPPTSRVTVSKVMLLVVALLAASVAAQKPGDILFLVSAAFSVAGAAFFPALVLGVFWKRANRWGAISGMLIGLGVVIYYVARNEPWVRSVLGITAPGQLWFGIQPIAAGVFGVPAGFASAIVVSWLTPPPPAGTSQWVEAVRHPGPPEASPQPPAAAR